MAAAKAACEKLGIGYHQLTTDRPLELTLFDFLRARMQRAKMKARRNGELGTPLMVVVRPGARPSGRFHGRIAIGPGGQMPRPIGAGCGLKAALLG